MSSKINHKEIDTCEEGKEDKKKPAGKRVRVVVAEEETVRESNASVQFNNNEVNAKTNNSNMKEEEIENGAACLVCKKNAATYEPVSCDQSCTNVYCKRCAMKFATGGRCKKCGKLFAGLRRSSN